MNSTIVSLAKSLNQVLTAAYHDVYGGDGTETLELVTSPLAATEEVINLHAAGLCPAEVAVPAALHALGASKEQIAKAVEDAVKLREKTEGKEDTVATDEKRSATRSTARMSSASSSRLRAQRRRWRRSRRRLLRLRGGCRR